MIERFNGRIADVLRTHRFDSTASLQTTLKRFVYLYNHHIPQKVYTTKRPSKYSETAFLDSFYEKYLLKQRVNFIQSAYFQGISKVSS